MNPMRYDGHWCSYPSIESLVIQKCHAFVDEGPLFVPLSVPVSEKEARTDFEGTSGGEEAANKGTNKIYGSAWEREKIREVINNLLLRQLSIWDGFY
jgi:hypothetical protein